MNRRSSLYGICRLLTLCPLLLLSALLPSWKASAAVAPSSPPAVFTASPLPLDQIQAIIPLGNLNPRGGHVFPTDHFYFDYGQAPGLFVAAPAAGTVFAIRRQSGRDSKIEVRVDAYLSYYLDHLLPESTLRVGSQLQAGQVVGHASARSRLDLGAYDSRVSLPGFVNPARYPAPTLHTVSPLALFSEPLKGQLYGKVDRAGPDKDGKIDFDRPGRLAGNWFHSSLSLDESRRGEPEVWARQIAFVYDVRQPSAVRISIGGTVAPAGVYGVQPGVPDPAAVDVTNGVVEYELRPSGSTRIAADEDSLKSIGFLRVQLVGQQKLKVQFVPRQAMSRIEKFANAASIYER